MKSHEKVHFEYFENDLFVNLAPLVALKCSESKHCEHLLRVEKTYENFY